jgi:hypothetical protein
MQETKDIKPEEKSTPDSQSVLDLSIKRVSKIYRFLD